MISSIRMTANTPAPAPAPAPPTTNPAPAPTVGDRVQFVAREAVGLAAGFALSMGGVMANASAGGAEGLIHGAKIDTHKDAIFQGVLGANLIATGAIAGGLQGALTNFVSGEAFWRYQGENTQKSVEAAADKWTDLATSHLPGKDGTIGRRIAAGAVGELAGLAAGGFTGATGLFALGQTKGEEFVDRISDKIRHKS